MTKMLRLFPYFVLIPLLVDVPLWVVAIGIIAIVALVLIPLLVDVPLWEGFRVPTIKELES